MVAQTWEAVAHPWKPMVPSGCKVGDRGEVGGGGREDSLALMEASSDKATPVTTPETPWAKHKGCCASIFSSAK